MKRKTIFEEKDITVEEREYPDIRGVEFWVTDGETGFGQGECPPLQYKHLKRLIEEYRDLSDEMIRNDLENEDFNGFFNNQGERDD